MADNLGAKNKKMMQIIHTKLRKFNFKMIRNNYCIIQIFWRHFIPTF